MDKLRKHIKESFFNPVLHFLPLLLFLVVDDFLGITSAWEISFPFALILLIYIFFAYNNIFIWHLISTIVFVLVSLFAVLETFLPYQIISSYILYETVVMTFFIVFLVLRKPIQKIVLQFMSGLTPMTNNFEELNRVIRAFVFVTFLYITGYLVVKNYAVQVHLYQQLLQSIYLGILFFLVIFELLRVRIIRFKLILEEWIPIVNNQGKIVGSIQQNQSLNDDKKYRHPVIRILFVDKGMILLHKKPDEHNASNDLWDSTISAHVVMEESIEQCVARTVKKKLEIEDFKYMFLSNYTVDCKDEIQYSFLFISCMISEFKLSERFVEQAKWWTHSQIELNLTSGNFTESFKTEYDLLKRSGLLETGKCECNCRLKQVIYDQFNGLKKE